jgi:hypothetical protein
MRRTLIVTVGLALVAAVMAAGWWTYQNRVWLRDPYQEGHQAGAKFDRKEYLTECQRRVDDRYGVTVSASMPEDAAAFTIGCYDAARDRYRPAAVGSLLAEFMGKSDVRFWPSW